MVVKLFIEDMLENKGLQNIAAEQNAPQEGPQATNCIPDTPPIFSSTPLTHDNNCVYAVIIARQTTLENTDAATITEKQKYESVSACLLRQGLSLSLVSKESLKPERLSEAERPLAVRLLESLQQSKRSHEAKGKLKAPQDYIEHNITAVEPYEMEQQVQSFSEPILNSEPVSEAKRYQKTKPITILVEIKPSVNMLKGQLKPTPSSELTEGRTALVEDDTTAVSKQTMKLVKNEQATENRYLGENELEKTVESSVTNQGELPVKKHEGTSQEITVSTATSSTIGRNSVKKAISSEQNTGEKLEFKLKQSSEITETLQEGPMKLKPPEPRWQSNAEESVVCHQQELLEQPKVPQDADIELQATKDANRQEKPEPEQKGVPIKHKCSETEQKIESNLSKPPIERSKPYTTLNEMTDRKIYSTEVADSKLSQEKNKSEEQPDILKGMGKKQMTKAAHFKTNVETLEGKEKKNKKKNRIKTRDKINNEDPEETKPQYKTQEPKIQPEPAAESKCSTENELIERPKDAGKGLLQRGVEEGVAIVGNLAGKAITKGGETVIEQASEATSLVGGLVKAGKEGLTSGLADVVKTGIKGSVNLIANAGGELFSRIPNLFSNKKEGAKLNEISPDSTLESSDAARPLDQNMEQNKQSEPPQKSKGIKDMVKQQIKNCSKEGRDMVKDEIHERIKKGVKATAQHVEEKAKTYVYGSRNNPKPGGKPEQQQHDLPKQENKPESVKSQQDVQPLESYKKQADETKELNPREKFLVFLCVLLFLMNILCILEMLM